MDLDVLYTNQGMYYIPIRDVYRKNCKGGGGGGEFIGLIIV